MGVVLNGVTTTSTGVLQDRVGKVYFKVVASSTTVAATALGRLGLIKLQVKHKSPSGETVLFPDGLLLRRLEQNTHLPVSSAIHLTNDGTHTTMTGSLLLVDPHTGGSINFGDREKMLFDVSAIPANTVVTMNAIEFPGNASTGLKFNYVQLDADSPTTVSVAGALTMAIPRAILTQVELKDHDGKSLILLPDEISDLMDDHKPNAYVKNGLVTPGGEELYIIDVDKFKTARVTVNTAGSAELLLPYNL
jgi:hypothetical protein